MRMRCLATLVILSTSLDAAPARQAWQWSVEERIAARMQHPARDVIRGSEHPELLLPSEVFRSLLHHVFAYDDVTAINFKRDAAAKAEAMGMPDDVLATIERLAFDAILAERRIASLRETMFGDPAQWSRLEPEYLAAKREACRERAKALAALRREIPQFDRFLYSAIAPNVFYRFDDFPDAMKLRDQEGGCR